MVANTLQEIRITLQYKAPYFGIKIDSNVKTELGHSFEIAHYAASFPARGTVDDIREEKFQIKSIRYIFLLIKSADGVRANINPLVSKLLRLIIHGYENNELPSKI